MTEYVLEVAAWTGAAEETLRYATSTLATGPTDVPAHTEYSGRIIDPGQLARSVSLLGDVSSSVGSIVLNNGDGALDDLLGYGFDGRVYTLKEIPGPRSPVGAATIIAQGVLAGIDTSSPWTDLRLRLRDQLQALTTPLLTVRYAGTTTSTGLGVEGDTDLTDKIKPYIFGAVTNIAPVLVNRFDLIWQCCVNAVSSITVYDGGVALTAGTDYANATLLQAATVAAGSYATCKALGLFKLGGSPAFTVTADVVEGSTAADRTAGQVVQRMLALPSVSTLVDIDGDSFDDLDAFSGAEVGIFIEDESTAVALCASILKSIGAALVPDAEGTLTALAIAEPSGTPVATFTIRDLIGDGSFEFFSSPSNDGGGVPAWSIKLTYGRVWRVQAIGELAGSVSLARQTLLGSATRDAVSQAAGIKTLHLLASEIVIDTLLTTQADALAEAARRLDMHGTRRDRVVITVPDDIGRLALGSVVSIDLPRFGFAGGKLMRVLGRTDDFAKHQVQLDCWG